MSTIVKRARSPIDPEDLPLRDELLRRSARDLDAMRAASAAGDVAGVLALAHRMAGAAGTFGLDELSRSARALEHAARGGDAAALREPLERTAAALRAALPEGAP
jgi:HPt (histidine-containing phosphotransfer) domain-containing protein